MAWTPPSWISRTDWSPRPSRGAPRHTGWSSSNRFTATPGPDSHWIDVEREDGTYDEVLVTPTPRWELPWFAEARGRGVARIRTGVVVLDDWAVTGHRALPAGTVVERAARRVLRGHPARRRHRLR